MALNAYLSLSGAKTGDVRGSVTQKGREGKIMVIAVSHEVISPRDAATGLAMGRRQHEPLVITKQIDRASPLLHQMQSSDETITRSPLDFWAPQVRAAGGAGTEALVYTITLAEASISSISTVMANNKDPALAKFETYEEVGFSYRQITWTWVDGAIVGQDDLRGQP